MNDKQTDWHKLTLNKLVEYIKTEKHGSENRRMALAELIRRGNQLVDGFLTESENYYSINPAASFTTQIEISEVNQGKLSGYVLDDIETDINTSDIHTDE